MFKLWLEPVRPAGLIQNQGGICMLADLGNFELSNSKRTERGLA